MLKNLDQFIENLLGGLNFKQKKVLEGRYGLRTGKRLTLQAIGDELHLTRERVRQIEEDSIKRVSPQIKAEAASLLESTRTYLVEAGGVRRDDYLISDLVNNWYKKSEAKHLSNKLRFLYLAGGTPFYSRENDDFFAFWYVNDDAKKIFVEFIKDAVNYFKDKKEVQPKDVSSGEFSNLASSDFLSVSKQFGVNVFGDLGLKDWAEIEPKTIRDKIYLVLKKNSSPLHFPEIARFINLWGIDKNPAHVQTVHNELIKDERFVLVGRGIYALREKGFEPGTVREVIARIFKKRGPLNSAEVIDLVNQERFLKENTILLSLQNKKHFKRLDDGRYHVREA